MKPKVFINNIEKSIKNNEESYHYEGNNIEDEYFHFNPDIDIIDVSDANVRSKINEIFSSPSFVYKSKVEIYLKDSSKLVVDLIAVKDGNIITLDNKKIPLDDILDIKKAS